MKLIEQVSKFLFVIGITLLIMSVLYPAGINGGESVDPGNYEGEFFLVTDAVYLQTTSREGNYTFSLYILDSDDVVQVLESGTMNGIEPLYALEDIMEYEGWLQFPEPGIYGLIVTHSHNESVIVWVHGIAFPRFSLIYAGLVLSLPMLVIVIGSTLQGKWLARKISEKA